MSNKQTKEIANVEVEQPLKVVIERVENKSEMIRRMHFVEGKSVSDIHRLTGIRYQMVRNIVVKERDARELANYRNNVKAIE